MLVRGENMIVTYEMLKESLTDYKAKDIKIKRMSDNKEIIKLTKNLYETNKNAPGCVVANAIYSPSYLSFDYALAYYGLIPEAVYTYTSATFGKGKKKLYKNDFGTYTYRDVPANIYPYCLQIFQEQDYSYVMATPEKALCDKLYTLKVVRNKKDMYDLLFNDLRMDMDVLKKLDFNVLYTLCDNYGSTNMKYLKKVLGDLDENNS